MSDNSLPSSDASERNEYQIEEDFDEAPASPPMSPPAEDEEESGAYEPHSPAYLPPSSTSEEGSNIEMPAKRRVIDSDDEKGPVSPSPPTSGNEDLSNIVEEERGSEVEEEEAENGSVQENDEVEAEKNEENDDDEEEEEGGDNEEEHDVGDIIADIFGEDEEDEEFKGFKEPEERPSSDESDEEVQRPRVVVKFSTKHNEDDRSKSSEEAGPSSFLPVEDSDFDKLMNKRREEQRRRRQRSRGMRSGAKILGAGAMDAEEREALEAGVDDIIHDADDIAMQLVRRMAKAAEEDRELAQAGQVACKKLLLLSEAIDLISNVDFQPSMFDNGILGAITDWLLPSEGSLPNITIRTELLRLIQQFPSLNTDQLKDSGLGKAIMILCKHPKEIRANKLIAKKMINEWARGVFNLSLHQSRDQREQQDLERLGERKRRLSSATSPEEAPLAKRPGDPGWIYRARVPQLSTKDYVVRPDWKVSDAPKASQKESMSRYERHARNLKERSAAGKKRYSAPSFIKFSLEGRKVL